MFQDCPTCLEAMFRCGETMNIPEIQVITLDKELIPLKLRLEEVVLALEKDGCVVLKEATDLTTIKSFTEQSPLEGLLSSVEKDIVVNRTVEAILFSAEHYDFRITNYRPYLAVFGQGLKGMRRDREGELIGSTSGLVGVNCIHLGGDSEVLWSIDVDGGSRQGATGQSVEVKANGGDIFICMAWLLYSVPRLEMELPGKAIMIVVSYLRDQFSDRGKIMPALAEKIVNLAGEHCHYKDQYLVWRRKRERE
ncbi:MAG: hypothetical protein M1840_000579 [Geoglossum simile]|nr:MAG: hypothetical protein M1840_000579 [Geoglossum simile]